MSYKKYHSFSLARKTTSGEISFVRFTDENETPFNVAPMVLLEAYSDGLLKTENPEQSGPLAAMELGLMACWEAKGGQKHSSGEWSDTIAMIVDSNMEVPEALITPSNDGSHDIARFTR